ncbi:hypothetical protein Tco_0064852 [Tanacetum coccineum]
MYHKKNVDYAYLLWEDFVYQVENKNVKRSNEMYYPCFTKVILNFFMTKEHQFQEETRHEDTQLYGAIFSDELTNEAIKDSKSYKEYYAIASGAEPPKTKASVKKKQARSDKTKTPPTAKGKRLKTSTEAAKPAKKKQPTKTSKAKGLTVGSGADEGTRGIPGVPDVPTYESNDEQISWKSNDEENDNDDNDDDQDNDDDNDDNDDDDDADNQDDDGQEYDGQDDDNEQTDTDNDGDNFFHPKFSTHDEEDIQEDGSDLRVETPSHYEESDEVTHGANIKGEELDEEETNEEDEANELYRDVNVNLEGRDTEMIDAPRTIT